MSRQELLTLQILNTGIQTQILGSPEQYSDTRNAFSLLEKWK